MRVLMLCTRRGSEDGFAVRLFHAGKCYDMADGLARYFLRRRWAMPCRDAKETADPPPAPVRAPFSFYFQRGS